ncbi:MAG: RnfABCDGE type electron transport complex subunit D [Candidatus Bathyarchaeota archaeon]|nr:RnfABCDGE type electron transport complex subunit D [Candidatus Bathyarchaeota archaeon]
MGIQKNVKSPMTKDLLMTYTFYALFFIAFLSYFIFGLQSLAVSLICVGVAILCDLLLAKVTGQGNRPSAAVFGLIVAMSYSLGLPEMMAMEQIPTLAGGLEQYLYPALITAVGLIVFKRIAGKAGRKYVNPAAIAKLLVLGLLFMPITSALSGYSALLPNDHTNSINLQNPLTPDAFGGPDFYPMDTAVFGSTLLTCYSNHGMDPYKMGTYENPLPDVLFTMLFAKFHGWIGGFSSLVVIVVGIALFLLARGYIKWRITVSFLVTTAIVAAVMGVVYGGDILLRVIFHVFMGSSIFMAFFMATDPATTPLTKMGQNIFGVGLAVLTVIIQTYTGFLGASILALVIMNVTCPILDRVGVPKPTEERKKIKLAKAQKFESAAVTDCIRCGKCMTVCCKNLPVILIKEAIDKGDWAKAEKLGVAYCDNCGHCSFVCPARIDLKNIIVSARDKIKKQ